MSRVRVVRILFEEHIPTVELPYFRGVLIGMSDRDSLFHNHIDQGYHYSYPKIQYKIIDGRAAVVGINEGAEALERLFSDVDSISCNLGRREAELNVMTIDEWYGDVIMTDENCTYRIDNWLPLNSRNYNEYIQADGLACQVKMLERILVGNILSFAKGINVFFDAMVSCRINDLRCYGNNAYKGVGFIGFSAIFNTNVLIPQWIGLGKSASLNHGIISYKP